MTMTINQEQPVVENTGLHGFYPESSRFGMRFIKFESDDGTSGSTTTGDTQPVVNQSSQVDEVKNPEGLLKAYQAVKAELAELKQFKSQVLTEKQKAEAKRLEEKQAFEALLPLKIEEALTPVNQSLQSEKSAREKAEKTAQTWQQKYEQLEKQYNGEKLKTSVNQLFSSIGGDPKAADLFYAAFQDRFTLNDGKPVVSDGSDPVEFLKKLKTDEVTARFFLAETPEGSGTAPQTGGKSTGSGDSKPRVISRAEALNLKKIGVTLEDIREGRVVIKD